MSSLNKGFDKVEVALKWNPNPSGAPAHDLDIVAATYRAEDPFGSPAYLVHFDSRSPDGTITLTRDSRDGQGFGADEVMTLELDRLAPSYTRVVVGVVIQQRDGRLTFGDIAHTNVRVSEGYTELSSDDLDGVAASTATTVAEFTRDAEGDWSFHANVRGFDADPTTFTDVMGGPPPAS